MKKIFLVIFVSFLSISAFGQKSKDIVGVWQLREIGSEVETSSDKVTKWLEARIISNCTEEVGSIFEYTKKKEVEWMDTNWGKYSIGKDKLTVKDLNYKTIYSYYLSRDTLILYSNQANDYEDWVKEQDPSVKITKALQTKLYIKLYKQEQLDTPAQFPGGEEALEQFRKENLISPQNTDDCKVSIPVIIDKTGQIHFNDKVRLHGGLSFGRPSMDDYYEAASKMFEGMPKWIPAKVDGETVNVGFRMMLKFEEN